MFQNMKVDIIYYKTNTDFEMEFNLCGCCRMRLLTDKSPDRKTMVHSLARAVSRSRIILVVGSLFGESGSIASIAGAIGSQLSVTDNKTFGIKSNDEIKIISGSTPLVTSDGIFGGCIIESGPQTMILLTDNKAVRKALMQTLIHPYIEELYANELKEKASQASDIISDNSFENSEDTDELILESDRELEEPTEELTEEQESDIITEVEQPEELEPIEDLNTDFLTEQDTDDENPPIYNNEDSELLSDITETEDLGDEDVLVSAGMIFETDTNEEEKPYIEPEEPGIISEENDDYDFEDLTEFSKSAPTDQDYLSEDDSSTQPMRKYSLNKPILILTVVLLLTIAILCYCIFFIPSKSDSTSVAFIKETFDILFG